MDDSFWISSFINFWKQIGYTNSKPGGCFFWIIKIFINFFNCLWYREEREASQKFVTWSMAGDFHSWAFLSASWNSLMVMSCHRCLSFQYQYYCCCHYCNYYYCFYYYYFSFSFIPHPIDFIRMIGIPWKTSSKIKPKVSKTFLMILAVPNKQALCMKLQ